MVTTETAKTDYTTEQLCVDLAIKLTGLAERVRKLERVRAAVKAHLANPGSATAEFELAHALKEAG